MARAALSCTSPGSKRPVSAFTSLPANGIDTAPGRGIMLLAVQMMRSWFADRRPAETPP